MANEQKNIQKYWGEFREAIENSDYKKIEKLTNFPFFLYGEADLIPVKKIKKSQFGDIIKKVLDQEQVIVLNSKMTSTTTRKIVIETRMLTESNILVAGGSFRVSDLVFEKINSHWKLVKGYLVDE